jgi:hypothetical protein
MPPVSYLFDWLWLNLNGPSEIGFRLFHSALVIAGVSGLALATLRELGPSATIVTLGFLVLSPKLIQTGVEVRAYPLFFAVTCAQVVVFLRLTACEKQFDVRLLTTFAATCLIAIYTHFYGVISSCAFFLALGILFLRCTATLGQIIGAFAVIVIGSLGLIPFLSGANQIFQLLPFVPETATAPLMAGERGTMQYLAYFLKLFGDPANMVPIWASILFFGGAIALLTASIFAAGMRMVNKNIQPVDGLILVVSLGAFATVMASFIVKFDALKSSYSVWLAVPLSLLIGAGVSSVIGYRPWDAAGRKAAVGALLMGAGISTYLFFAHASMFVHGPHRFIGNLYSKIVGPKAIIYEIGSAWGWSYIPLAYSHKAEVVQYRTPDNGAGLVRAGRSGTEGMVQEIEATVIPYQVLLLTDIRLRTYKDLRQCQNQPSACPDFPPGPIEGALVGTGKWREIGKERSFGFYDCQVTILKRWRNETGEN